MTPNSRVGQNNPNVSFHLDRLSDFKVIGKIGSGGFGIVYLVSINKESQRRKEGKDVFAMKVIDKVKLKFLKSKIERTLSSTFRRSFNYLRIFLKKNDGTFHLATLIYFLLFNFAAYFPSSIRCQDSNRRPFGCKLFPLTR